MDVDRDGRLRGWSLRLAERIAGAQGGLLYANLAVRGATTREVVERQLERALSMRPDLATVFSGTNDVFRARFDPGAFAADVTRLQGTMRAAGATVLTFTLPDLTPLLPLARVVARRILRMNEAVRAACADTGTRLVDLATVPFATDTRLWHADRIHANAEGHARIADALAEALGLPGSNGAWRSPLPETRALSPAETAWRELRWSARYLLPWGVHALFVRGATARSEGRMPQLGEVRPS